MSSKAFRLALILSTCAVPATAQPVTGDDTVRTITKLSNQIAILNQQLAIAKLQAQIAEANKTVSHDGMGQAALPSIEAPVATGTGGLVLPTVVSIIGGANARLTATLQLPNGDQVTAWPGEGLPGGLTVYDIGARGVLVMQGGNLVTLPFAGDDMVQVASPSPRIASAPIAPPIPVPPGQ